MSKSEKIKEQIGWLKIVFGLLVATEVSMIGWLWSNVQHLDTIRLALAGSVICATGFGIGFVNRMAFKRMDDLGDL